MEVTSASVTGPMRLALQVVSDHKRPLVEVYFEVRNRKALEEFESENFAQTQTRTHKYRRQILTVHFFMTNLGGIRAEDVQIEVTIESEEPERTAARLRGLSGKHIPQFSPAQVLTLCNLDDAELFGRSEEGKPDPDNALAFTLTTSYNGPRQGLNRTRRWWTKLRRRQHQFTSTFKFDAGLVHGLDLPPAEYV